MQSIFLENLKLMQTDDVNQSDVLFDLCSYGLIRVNGVDAKKLLQGQLTCDVENLKQGTLCAHCNPQGRVISLFYLFQQNADYYLALPRNMIAIATSTLKKYAIFYKVTIEDVSNDFHIISASQHIADQLAENNELINVSVVNSYSMIIGKNTVLQSAVTTLSAIPLLASENSWKLINLHAKIPQIYPETSAMFLPHELNLDKLNAIDFSKGCYTGQEIIARMHYKGKLKNHLYSAQTKNGDLPMPGNQIYANTNEEIKASGNVVDACKENDDTYFLLLVTNDENIKNNCLALENNRSLHLTT